MKSGRSTSRQSGFTLVELIISIAIVAVIAGLGIPSFVDMIRDNDMVSRANSVMAGVQLARSEAIKRSRPVSICPSTDGATCTGGGNWAAGWIVFTDTNSTGNPAVSQVLRETSNKTSVSSVSGSPDFIRFMGTGLRASGSAQAVIDLERPSCGQQEGRTITVSATGRTSAAKKDC
jgi:type IV fimbrial biogenesis protein FimT